MSHRTVHRFVPAVLAVAAVLTAAGLALAHDGDVPAGRTGVKNEILLGIQDGEDKLAELAEAFPEKKYGWTPAKGVRTVGDIFMHVAAANYGLPTFIGVPAPAGFDFKTFEHSLTKKSDIMKAMKDSFTHLKAGFERMSDADLDKPAELFGRKTTVRGTYLVILSHIHEHLGQAIAYARSNKVTPPWTARQAIAEAEAAKK